MESHQWWATLSLLLARGLAVESAADASGYMVTVTGVGARASGVGGTLLEALQRASWRWTLN